MHICDDDCDVEIPDASDFQDVQAKDENAEAGGRAQILYFIEMSKLAIICKDSMVSNPTWTTLI